MSKFQTIRNINKDDIGDTAEAFSHCIFTGNNNIVIPYINFHLMRGNPVNGIQSFIDYSYYVFLDVRSLMINPGISDGNQDSGGSLVDDLTIWVTYGGYKSSGGELAIIASIDMLLIPGNANIRPHYINNTYNGFKLANMYAIDVEKFFSRTQLPDEVVEILGVDFFYINVYPNK